MSTFKNLGLKYDPFSSMPLATELELSLFVDREEELRKATSTVLLGKNLLISGQRGIGKTSLIWALRNQVRKQVPDTLFVDVRLEFGVNDSTGFLSALATELEICKQKELPLSIERIKKTEEFNETVAKAPISDLISLINSSLLSLRKEYSKILLIFDDLDKMSIQLGNLAGIRDALWKTDAVYIVSSSLKQFEETLNSAMEPFFNFIELSDFDKSLTKLLIEKRLQFAAVDLNDRRDLMDDEVIDQIYKLSQGNPNRILSICSFAFHHSIERNSSRITLADLSSYFEQQLLHTDISNSALKVMSILQKCSSLSVNEIYEELKKEGLNITRPRVSQILGDLSDRGILTVTQHGRSRVYSTIYSNMEKSN